MTHEESIVRAIWEGSAMARWRRAKSRMVARKSGSLDMWGCWAVNRSPVVMTRGRWG